MPPLNRRDLPKGTSATAAAVAASELLSLALLRPAHAAVNPLKHYPDRDWEQLYRNVHAHDDSYILMCTPNCTDTSRSR